MIYTNFDQQVQESANIPNYLADINEDTVEESIYEPTLEGVMMHVLEAEENWNKIQQAIAFSELSGFNESGDVEYVMEAEQQESMFSKIIAWFKSMGQKIVSLFKKFVNYMASKVASDKHFVKKFEAVKSKLVVPQGFNFKGFKFDFSFDIKTGADKARKVTNSEFKYDATNLSSMKGPDSNLKSELDKIKSNKSSFDDRLRGAVLGQDGSVSSKEFNIELKKLCRSGKVSPESISVSSSDVDKYFEFVKSHKSSVDDAKKTLKGVTDDINTCIDTVKKCKDVVNKIEDKSTKSAAMSYISALTNALKQRTTLLARVNGGIIDALNQQNRQAKSVIYAIYARQTTKLSESTSIFDRLTME